MAATFPTMQNTIRLVIADDHEIFRDGLALMLSKQENLSLVGQAADGRELIQLVAQEQPDIVLTDIKMPRLDGIEASIAWAEKTLGPNWRDEPARV